jgi:hypothetical protein
MRSGRVRWRRWRNVLDDEATRQGIKEFFELSDDSAALCKGGIRRRLRHRPRDASERRASEALARQGRGGREIAAMAMSLGSLGRKVDVKAGLGINKEA